MMPDNATIWGRYEYDTYGNVHVMDSSFNPRSGSSFDNAIYFTGRRLDTLDCGACGGADMTFDGNVDGYDLDELTTNWLYGN